MKNKNLADMIKSIRKKKLEEIIGKPGPFTPTHHTATHGEDPESPNQYAHKMAEARVPSVSGGAQGKATLGNLKVRVGQQKARGRQNQRGRFLNSLREKQETELGTTDTGKSGKESETVDVNPKDTSALSKGSLNKNITVKETKEK